jgi:hypothetical protein
MKTFLIKISAFLGIVLLIMGGIYVFNRYELNKAPQLGNTEVLVVGDSRLMTAINPDLIPHCTNTAQNSESYIISYYKLKYLLAHTPTVKKVILGFSYPSFSAYLDGIFKDDIATADVFNRIYPIMSLSDFHGLEVDWQKYYQVVFKNMLVYPHTNHHKYLGGFVKLKPGIERANLDGTIMRHYFDKDTNNIGISKVAHAYLDSILILTQQKNIELVLVNVPLHKDYLKRVPKNFIDYYDQTKKELESEHIRILDYGNLVLEDKYFKDYNHLDEDGANYITKIIARDIQALD